MMTSKLQCRYSIIRFMPHIETGEFANVGIVLVAPQIGFLGSRLEARRYGRITSFFDTVAPEYYRNAVGALQDELQRVKKLLPKVDRFQARLDLGKDEPALVAFNDLTRLREGLVNFSAPRVVISEDPRRILDDLFGYYVERNFVTQRYRETVLEDLMKKWLNDIHLGERFVRRQFDDGVYKATFPFVENNEIGGPKKIIKPFFLGQKEPTAIIDHGIKWSTSVARLRRAGLLPNHILFAVEGPVVGPGSEQAHQAAYEETVETLRRTDIDVVSFEHQQAILSYAQQEFPNASVT
ncbi:MAG: DUF3037 domain-containing protein [Rhizobiaceae bacterium]|nr:DUF3037 domain-containing protein [Rhizobiaceae bacterium]MCV0407221.1 DUF3037 domain-containing protein [Rhizobiaceae bacterium]